MTDNPLFYSLTEEQKQQYLRWKNFSQCKSKVLTKLYRKTPQSGYSCDMIIIDDVIEKQYSTDPMQKLLDDYKVWHDKKASSLFSASELQAKLGVATTND